VSYVLQNAATAELYGGELEVTAEPVADLNVRAAFTYLHSEYASFPRAQTFRPVTNSAGVEIGGNVTEEFDVSGNQMMRAPKYTISGGINWSTDLAGGRFQAIGNLYWSSKVYYDFRNLFFQDSYTTISGELAWTTPDEAWRFSLWGRNLTNEAILTQVRLGPLDAGVNYDRPREVGVGASFRF